MVEGQTRAGQRAACEGVDGRAEPRGSERLTRCRAAAPFLSESLESLAVLVAMLALGLASAALAHGLNH